MDKVDLKLTADKQMDKVDLKLTTDKQTWGNIKIVSRNQRTFYCFSFSKSDFENDNRETTSEQQSMSALRYNKDTFYQLVLFPSTSNDILQVSFECERTCVGQLSQNAKGHNQQDTLVIMGRRLYWNSRMVWLGMFYLQPRKAQD